MIHSLKGDKSPTVTKFIRCAIYHQKWMRLDPLSLKPYSSAIPGFVAYLIKDTALNDVCGKTLGILSF